MLKKHIDVADVENVAYRLKLITNIFAAIQTAMVDGCESADEYTDALFGAVMYLEELQTAMDALYQKKDAA